MGIIVRKMMTGGCEDDSQPLDDFIICYNIYDYKTRRTVYGRIDRALPAARI